MGAGRNQQEATAYGIDLLPMKQRMDRFEEAVEVIVRLLSDETTDFDGRYYRLTHARCEPKGPQRPHPPIVIGGGGERRTLRVAARFARHWNLPFATPEIFRHKREVLLRHCLAVGRDAEEITCSVQLPFPADGDPSEAAARAAALADAGAHMVIFTLRTPYRASVVEPLAKALAPLR